MFFHQGAKNRQFRHSKLCVLTLFNDSCEVFDEYPNLIVNILDKELI